MKTAAGLSWVSILRLGLAQTAIGAMVVLTTSTLNRVMVVEYGLAATVPGSLVALHYVIQMLRPRFGHGADVQQKRTRWIIAGLTLLAAGTVGAALATPIMESRPVIGFPASILAFLAIGLGVGAAGTNLLALVAAGVTPARRAQSATILWTMMIAGFAVTAGVAGAFLDPYTPERLLTVTSCAAVLALVLGTIAVSGIEKQLQNAAPRQLPVSGDFRTALTGVLQEPQTRRFTFFVFVSMLAFSGQDLVLEPFAGLVFAMTPGETTSLSGTQHGATVAGMLVVALIGWCFSRKAGVIRALSVVGCLGSAASLAALAFAGGMVAVVPLSSMVACLGFFNGIFAVSAIGAMMSLAAEGGTGREGTRMGLWGAAQAIAFAAGGFCATLLVDATGRLLADETAGFPIVFMAEAVLFIAAAWLAARSIGAVSQKPVMAIMPDREDRVAVA